MADEGMDPRVRARLRAALIETVGGAPTGRRRHGIARAVAIGAGTAVAAGVVVLGIQALRPAPEAPIMASDRERPVVLCLGLPSVEFDGAAEGQRASAAIGVVTTIEPGSHAESRMLDACTRLWQDGTLGGIEFQYRPESDLTSNGPQSTTEGGGLAERKPVPSLVLCKAPDALAAEASVPAGTPVAVPMTSCAEWESTWAG